MALKVQPTLGNDNIARTRADILMTHGSYAAVEALALSAQAHSMKAAFEADAELREHWREVWAILEDAKRKLGDLK